MEKFVGRSMELHFLTEYFQREGSQILVVYGSKGVGKTALRQESRLYEEMSLYLLEELREPAVYYSILAAMARDCNKLNDIYKHTGFSRAKISVYLKNLMELDLVEKVSSYETGSRWGVPAIMPGNGSGNRAPLT